MNFTNEQINKARLATTPEELLSIAKENGIKCSLEQAQMYYSELHKQGELSDDELDTVVGGDKGDPDPKYYIGQSLCINGNSRNRVTVQDKEFRSDGKWWYYVTLSTYGGKGQSTWYAEESLYEY